VEEVKLPQKMIGEIKAAEAQAALALERARHEAEDRRRKAAIRAQEILAQARQDVEKESASVLEKARHEAARAVDKAATENDRQCQEIQKKAAMNKEKAVQFILQQITGAEK
jgi:vacuolar-type H+-ATPase subunit H